MTNPSTKSSAPAPTFSELVRATEPAPPLSPALPGSVELASTAFEVAIKWGDDIVSVTHCDPPRSFYLGDGEGCDFVIPAGLVDSCRSALVEVDRDGQICIRVPSGGEAEISDGGRFSNDDSPLIPLGPGRLVRVKLGALVFEIRGVSGEKKQRSGFGLSRSSLAGIAASAVGHIGLLLATAAFMPALSSGDDYVVTEEQRYTMQHYLDSAAETEREATESSDDSSSDAGSPDGAGDDEPGAASTESRIATALTHGRGGPLGPAPSVPIDAQDALRDARTFGMIEVLTAHQLGNVPSPWNTAIADMPSSLGNLATWSGDPLAPNGPLQLTNPTGFGSDISPAGWYRVGDLMPRRPGCANYPCTPEGFDRLGRLSRGGHKATSPSVRVTTPSSTGAIPAAVVQRIVRANYGRFRACYENGLRTNPGLEGRVVVNFLIGRDGTVKGANSAGSSLPDGNVSSCIASSFRGLTFPAPEHGTVSVTYPIVLSAPNA